MTDQSTKTATELSPERQAERDDVLTKARKAKAVSQHTMLSTQQKNDLLQDSADALEANVPAILAANEKDLEAGRENGFNDSLLDRLALDEARIKLSLIHI